MESFALMHYGAVVVGAIVGFVVPMHRKASLTVCYILGAVGVALSLVIFPILMDPAGGSNAGGSTDLLFIYGILLFIPFFIVLPLLGFAGWAVAFGIKSLLWGRPR